MKKNFVKIISIIFFCATIISCGSQALKDDCGCFMEYDEAVAYAQKKNLPILVFFTSEGDDDYSNQLVNMVMKTSAFAENIGKNYVIYHADFSQNVFSKTVVSDNPTKEEQETADLYYYIIQQNYQYSLLFDASTTPCAFLCTKDGYVVSAIEIDEKNLNTAGFAATLKNYDEQLKKFNDMVAATKIGSAQKKVEAIDTLYMATEETYRRFLLNLVKKVPQLDKNNKSGLCSKYIVGAAEAEALSYFAQGDLQNTILTFLKAADNPQVRAVDKQECFYTAASLLAASGANNYKDILSLLQSAYQFDTTSANAASIQKSIDYFTQLIEQSEKTE